MRWSKANAENVGKLLTIKKRTLLEAGDFAVMRETLAKYAQLAALTKMQLPDWIGNQFLPCFIFTFLTLHFYAVHFALRALACLISF